MDIKRVKYFFLAVEDKPGEVARLCALLKQKGVDLNSLWALGLGIGKAQLYVVARDAQKFENVLNAEGWEFKKGTCFQIISSDELGVVSDMLGKIGSAGINLLAMDAIAVDGKVGYYLWSREDEVEKLGKVLGA